MDLDGGSVRPLSARTSVLVFARTDCPVSNRYAPEIARIHNRYAGPRTSFFLVYVDPSQPVDELRRHAAEYAYPFTAVVDRHGDLVRLARARITPQAAVIHDGKLVYTGRIDNRYIEFGRSRATASRHDLEDVLASLEAGRTPHPRSTRAVGCFIGDVR
jgi:hypothetical protein